MNTITTASYGYPRIGRNRELKFALEKYWQNKISKEELFNEARLVHLKRLDAQKTIDHVLCNDFFMYDAMLNHSLLFNAIPERFQHLEDPLDLYFSMARGSKKAVACEMTKWFDTNYHYIVPELNAPLSFQADRAELFLEEHQASFPEKDRAVYLIGPFTYLYLSKLYEDNVISDTPPHTSPYWVEQVLNVYVDYLSFLEKKGVKRVHIDEPAFTCELSVSHIETIHSLYKAIRSQVPSLHIDVMTYYEEITPYDNIVGQLPVDGIGLDLSTPERRQKFLSSSFPSDKRLLAGVLSARYPWRSSLEDSAQFIRDFIATGFQGDIVLTHAGPLSHLPHTTACEKDHLPEDLLSKICFADERLEELASLKNHLVDNTALLEEEKTGFQPLLSVPKIAEEARLYRDKTVQRKESFAERSLIQKEEMNLPPFPTTTIGSFPQDNTIREMRRRYNQKDISKEEYDSFLEQVFKDTITLQEDIGLDVLVHGEAERTDMVEFFAQRLSGIDCTRNGWVQSYGSRCTRPPLIHSDISRESPMTVDVMKKTQSFTERYVKGMLTGPITIICWSFYRTDIPKEEVAYQIALALKEEVLDLEKNGIQIIQIDEPAIREGLPLKKDQQQAYLDWAIKAFKLTHHTVQASTQIHTHMCYSEFNEIIHSIQAMDADVVSIEASRSQGDILRIFQKFSYKNQIGPGVYDIHSPRLPTTQAMVDILHKCLQYIDRDLLWVNPDCGLKTRQHDEVVTALKNMVEAARILREKS